MPIREHQHQRSQYLPAGLSIVVADVTEYKSGHKRSGKKLHTFIVCIAFWASIEVEDAYAPLAPQKDTS